MIVLNQERKDVGIVRMVVWVVERIVFEPGKKGFKDCQDRVCFDTMNYCL